MNAQISCLTPPGSGAIAVIALFGLEAWPIVRRHFRSRSRPLPEVPTTGDAWLGSIGPGVGDEVLLVMPHSSTSFEIHCHGGRQVVRMILDLFNGEGVEVKSSRDDYWSRLAEAKTLRTASILLDQSRGVFGTAVRRIKDHFVEGRKTEAQSAIAELTCWLPLGKHLITPWKIAIAGRPNAGKSSLLNALAGFQRSIVAPIPGTTRDVVTLALAFDGWPMELADTAGLREGGDALEQAGISRARIEIQSADLCLWVIDATEPDLPDRKKFLDDNCIANEKLLPVVNKIDQRPSWNLGLLPDAIVVSATTNQGLELLIQKCVARLIPEVPPAGAAVPSCPEEWAWLERARLQATS